ncbi:ArsR family transcriptional regulator [Sporomusaceae bacterium BoRhaA]|nr:ArsR family transcriptional regulator [Pelorhabdus rhamnosifermentans]
MAEREYYSQDAAEVFRINEIGDGDMDVIEILKALSDENRLRILNLLNHGELCVCDIERITQLSQSNLSKHLNKLRMTGLIKAKKRAQWVFYSLNEDCFLQYSFLKALFNVDIQQVRHYEKDIAAKNAIEDLTCGV